MNRIQGPRGREYPEHNPKTVALLGMGPSVQDFMTDTLTQELKPGFAEEVWGINMTVHTFRCDLCFWMDDLEEQSKLTPHVLMPTTHLKQIFARDKVGGLIDAGGDKMAALVATVESAPEYIRTEDYEFAVEEFKSLLNGPLQGISYGSVIGMLQMVDQDKKGAVPDESRSLKGLIECLDRTGVPVITAHRKPDFVKNSFDYPLDEVAQLAHEFFGKVYLSNGVAMAIAYAMWKGVTKMRIYGCDFTYPNRNYAETGRACVESWIAYASTKGMEIQLPPHTSLLDTQGDIGIYGYKEQPAVYLADGSVLQYKPTPEMGGNFYRPEVVGKHAGVTNEFLVSANADSASGRPASRCVPGENGLGLGAHGITPVDAGTGLHIQ